MASTECFVCGRLLRARNSLYYTFDGATWKVRVCSVCHSGAKNTTVRTAYPWRSMDKQKTRATFKLEGVRVNG